MDDSEFRQLDRIANDRKFLLQVMLRGFLLSTAWAVLVAVMNPGTLMGIVQVVFFVATLLLVAFGAYMYFRSRLPRFVSILAAVGVWLLWVVLYRSVVLAVLGAI